MRRASHSRASAVGLALACIAGHASGADNPAEIFELPAVQVVGTAPLPGLGTPLRDVPANVQIFGNAPLARTRPLSLAQLLDRNAGSANAASGQGNPYQQSLDFRGFAASPLLGTPQGLSVFQDGVRINEPFGDVVNWDLLPRSAISSLQLIPGSVPAFGLNTLGGALAIYTKSGAQYPGSAVDVSAGSFGRHALEFEYGHADEHIDAFATGHFSEERGWAMHNASRVRQFFGKLGIQNERSDLDVSMTLADNALNGAQTLPLSFIDRPREPYTYPDVNENRLAFVVAKASRLLADDALVDANVYYRAFHNSNLSSNVDDAFGDGTDDVEHLPAQPATNDRATIRERSFGFGVQWSKRIDVRGYAHRLALGGSASSGSSGFTQASQAASFMQDRGTMGVGPYLGTTDVALRNRDAGVYVSDAVNLDERWTLTVAARYNAAQVVIEDRSGADSALDGRHGFSRLNPAVGVNFNPTQSFTAYASYNEGMRAPTPVELTCADPEAPCKLPNQFLADPALSKVVSATVEAGVRGKWAAGTWSAALYRTELQDDLAFVASGGGATNAGYFRNVGQTRRQGIELASTVRSDPFTIGFRYSAIDARFRSTFDAQSPDNSEADPNGAIVVHAGNRIPGIPVHTAKMRVDWDATPGFAIGASLVAVSSQYARGDENNADRSGRVPGYFVAHVDANVRLTPRVTLFAQIDNLFDRRYANFGVLGANAFTGPGRTFGPAAGVAPVGEQFRALGAPRGIWVGVRVSG